MAQSSPQVDPDPTFWTKTAWIQLGYGFWVNLSFIGNGLALGFSAVTVPQLKNSNSPIAVTINEEALIASVITLSCPIGNCLSGIMLDRCGRKITLVLCEVPMVFGWIYMGFAENPKDIIVGRILTGVGMGMKMVAPRAYTTEITLPNMRGLIGAIPNLMTSIGIVCQATLGTYLNWNLLCYISGSYAALLMFSYLFLPDTPYYVLLKSTASKAMVVLKKFRSRNFNVDAEMNDLNEFKEVNEIRRLGPLETINAMFRPSSCKPFSIVAFYVILMQMVGCNVVIMWTVEMLQDAKSSIDPNLGNVLLGAGRIVFGIITSILLYKMPRRALAIISAIGLGAVCICLGSFLKTDYEESPYPLILQSGYIMFATLGYYSLPFIMMFELLPLQVRGIMSGIVFSIMSLSMFGANQLYPYMREELGLGYIFITYGVISLAGAVILYFILPETKDLTLQEIEEYFNSIRPTLVSQRQVMSMQLQAMPKSSQQSHSKKTKSQESTLSDAHLHELYSNKHKDHDHEKKHEKQHKHKHDKRKPNSSVIFKDSKNDIDKSKNI